MTKHMLIDTTHVEETRVVVMDGNRLEDYDVETSSKKHLKGNVYLAKVVRVEPSLQAAFVDYGGNRHGFLAFSEIHPDYYQIPVADREKLIALQEDEARAEEIRRAREEAEDEPGQHSPLPPPLEQIVSPQEVIDLQSLSENLDEEEDEPDGSEQLPPPSTATQPQEEENPQSRLEKFLRSYKIQDVIHRRQIILAQVVKEERGNKGAALTTYVSLAGRYSVLMPNTPHGGGISRKITSLSDRKRLRNIINTLNIPNGMTTIIRTAGAQRPETEIIRDCEYLLKLWDTIREQTFQSLAPTLVYEEANLIKRAIRDLYTQDIQEILVDGEQGWKAVKDFVQVVMPQNARKVSLWPDDNVPLFTYYQAEKQLDSIQSSVVQLRSGGYLVINQTEALVAIDVNSGRSTRERNIEETALRTNLEATEEVARQLRLRDLAGLIVVDFIDMSTYRHNTMVEKRLKNELRNDRARIQIGRISPFGLLEMSRQRLRPSISESSLMPCPHCDGVGSIRTDENAALYVLRLVEEEASNRKAAVINVKVKESVALYILNHKRSWLIENEERYNITIFFKTDESLSANDVQIERLQLYPQTPAKPKGEKPVEQQKTGNDQTGAASLVEEDMQENSDHIKRKRRRRRRGGGSRPDTSVIDAVAIPPIEEPIKMETVMLMGSDGQPQPDVPSHALSEKFTQQNQLPRDRRNSQHSYNRYNSREENGQRPNEPLPSSETHTTRDHPRIDPDPFARKLDIFELMLEDGEPAIPVKEGYLNVPNDRTDDIVTTQSQVLGSPSLPTSSIVKDNADIPQVEQTLSPQIKISRKRKAITRKRQIIGENSVATEGSSSSVSESKGKKLPPEHAPQKTVLPKENTMSADPSASMSLPQERRSKRKPTSKVTIHVESKDDSPIVSGAGNNPTEEENPKKKKVRVEVDSKGDSTQISTIPPKEKKTQSRRRRVRTGAFSPANQIEPISDITENERKPSEETKNLQQNLAPIIVDSAPPTVNPKTGWWKR